jgi:hypothetical protein
MRQLKKTLILLGILIGLILVIYCVNIISSKIEKSKTGAQLFGKFKPENTQKIVIAARWNNVVLAQTPAGWVVASADSFPADTAEVNKVIAALQGMIVKELVSTNPQKHQVFQVDSVSGVRVMAIAQNKDTVADVIVGKNGTDYNSTYFRPRQSKNVYLYDQNLRSLFSKNSVNWRDTYVLKLDRENVTRLTLEYPGQTLELAKSNDGVWKIAKPQESAAKQNLVNDMINTVAMLNSKDMQRLNLADATYGFNKSPCTVTVTDKNNNRFVLVVGAYNEKDKDYFIKNNFRNYVYKINDYQANSIMKRFEELEEEVPAPAPAEKKDTTFKQK